MTKLYLKPLRGSEPLTKFYNVVNKSLPTTTFQGFYVSTNILKDISIGQQGTPANWASQINNLQKMLDERPWATVESITANALNNSSIKYELSDDRLSATISLNNIPQICATGEKLADALHEEFKFCHPEDIVLDALPEVQQKQLRVAERALADLTAATAKLSEEAARLTTQQAQDFNNSQKALREQSDAEHKKMLAEQERLDNARKAKEDEFNEKVKQFELREGTAVRRQRSEQARQKIQASVGTVTISADTLKERQRTHFICISVLIVASILMIAGIAFVLLQTNPTALHYVPLAAVTVIFGSTLWFYLKFNYLWADRLAQAELTRQKYSLDFDRADWLSELLTEDATKEFSPEVAARFAQNLFTEVQWSKQNMHPGDDVFEFISRLSKLKAGKEGVALELATNEDKKKKK